MRIRFIKMHGLGNDFVVIDKRGYALEFAANDFRFIADRHFGIGCDQVIVLEAAEDADILMKIYNADGTDAGACGNAARCIAKYLDKENGSIRICDRILQFVRVGDDISLNMGKATIIDEQVFDGYRVNIGNNHLVIFKHKILEDEFNNIASSISRELDVNVGFAKVESRFFIDLRVWERGSGPTLACGSGACAAGFIANKLGLCEKRLEVKLSGGILKLEILDDDTVNMIGGASFVFRGEVDI